ncbi:MAG: hypothetical protein P857_785 [Candidatus Xenolissoclinum pacificiensis L6]|uniref:Outer membrane lipoprotein BamD-like domain-containing protein n=1 Tax=Candidatus Xenolissoclinum pacificiensis L6 TaxID=1401685 RepID=W2UZM6_9RICK|nr:MAG: hypothetical protein P857_785 [Candidatus Xenolissoclinum pacificiensis L6]
MVFYAKFSSAKVLPAETLYGKVVKKFEHYQETESLVEKLSNAYPFSDYTKRARLLLILSHVVTQEYSEAVFDAETYLSLYPHSKDNEFVYYLMSMSYFKQIKDHTRNTHHIQNMIETVKTMKTQYPQSVFLPELHLRIEHILQVESKKALEIGKYYARRSNHIAAINRYYEALQYNNKYKEESLFRLMESYDRLSLSEESDFYKNKIISEFPESNWLNYLGTI